MKTFRCYCVQQDTLSSSSVQDTEQDVVLFCLGEKCPNVPQKGGVLEGSRCFCNVSAGLFCINAAFRTRIWTDADMDQSIISIRSKFGTMVGDGLIKTKHEIR